MDKTKVLKYGGIVAVVIGAGALFMSGTGEANVMAIVGGVFVLAGVIAAILKS